MPGQLRRRTEASFGPGWWRCALRARAVEPPGQGDGSAARAGGGGHTELVQWTGASSGAPVVEAAASEAPAS
jgi:hypothetical protein